ncbi:MAG: hypothetical protein ACYTBJ_05390 [Planctomycetota bacterium]|jgi:hypothetical protein
MASLAELYGQIVATDEEIVKVAGAEAVQELIEEHGGGYDEDGTMKIAAEYDAAGRIMARAYFDEMQKEAMPRPGESEEDYKKRMKGEGKDDEKDEKDEKKKKYPEGMAAMMAEKKAALKQRMLDDPEFAQAMFEQYAQSE